MCGRINSLNVLRTGNPMPVVSMHVCVPSP